MMLVDVTLINSYHKPFADSTLNNMKKSELIEYVRMLEHNYNVAVSFNHQQAKNFEKMLDQKWIPVSDETRKPKDRRNYFIAYVFGNSTITFFGDAKYHADGDNGYVQGAHFSNEGVDGMRVTHWMEIPPLPKPPKECE